MADSGGKRDLGDQQLEPLVESRGGFYIYAVLRINRAARIPRPLLDRFLVRALYFFCRPMDPKQTQTVVVFGSLHIQDYLFGPFAQGPQKTAECWRIRRLASDATFL